MKIIFTILFFLFLIIFPTGELLRFKIADNVLLVPQDILIALMSLIVVIDFVSGKSKPKEKEFVLFSIIFIATGTISLIINSFFNPSYNFLVSLLYGVRYLLYLTIFFYQGLLFKNLNPNKWIMFSGFIVVVIGILQFLFYKDLGNLYYLGWDNHLYRLFSTFLDPNFVGIFYVVYFGFVLSRIKKISDFKNNLVELTFLFLTFVAIYLTYSRSAFIALVVFIFSLFILNKRLKEFILILILLFGILFMVSDFKVEGLNPFRTFSSAERIKSAQNAISVIKDSPIFGVGFNAYRYAQIEHGFRTQQGTVKSNADAGTDNSFLFIIATTGIAGLITFISGYYFILRNLIQGKKFSDYAIYSSVVALFVGSFFVNSLFYIPIISFLFLVITFKE